MTFVGNDKPSLEELSHHGVKGMRWGVRKSEPSNSGYSQSKRVRDESLFSKRGVKRINRRMNKGQSHKQAVRREITREIVVNTSIKVGLAAATVALHTYGPSAASAVLNRAEANRGRNAVIAIMAKEAKTTYIKPKRGVYNITTM